MADPRDIQIHMLQEALRDLAVYASVVRNTNTNEWMFGLVKYLNEAGRLLIEPQRFVCNQRSDGKCWITYEDIP